jgi:hypothetical protein
MFKWSMFNKINIRLFTQQVQWLGGNGIELQTWESKDQTIQMTCVVVNVGILIEYFIPTKTT